jgi:hypothetical protein
MAASYRIVSELRTVQVLSQTQVSDVQQVGFIAYPSGTYCQTEIPWDAWVLEGPAAWVQPLAQAIEDLIAGSGATAATFVQDVDASGLIADFLDFTVSFTPTGGTGIPLTTVVRIPVTWFGIDTSLATAAGMNPAVAIHDAYERLVADAGL